MANTRGPAETILSQRLKWIPSLWATWPCRTHRSSNPPPQTFLEADLAATSFWDLPPPNTVYIAIRRIKMFRRFATKHKSIENWFTFRRPSWSFIRLEKVSSFVWVDHFMCESISNWHGMIRWHLSRCSWWWEATGWSTVTMHVHQLSPATTTKQTPPCIKSLEFGFMEAV